jgi:hypothetical protein
LFCNSTDDAAMGVRTRGLDIAAAAKRQVAAACAEAEAIIGRWNEQLAGSRDTLWSPTIRAALIAGTPRLRHEPGNRSSKGRPPSPRVGCNPRPRASLLVVPGIGANTQVLGLHALPPAAKSAASNL